jgi:RecA-family ATPase
MEAQSNKHKIWRLSELIADTTPRPQAIIDDGILNAQSLLLIAGQQKAKKSFLAMNMAVAMATGRSFACFNIHRPHRVLVLSAEGGFHSNKERVIKMCANIQAPSDDFLHLDFGTRWKLDNKANCKELSETIDEIKPEVVIIDPLVKFHLKDENSTQEMMDVLNAIRNIIEDKNVSVILVHHLGKSIGNGARGSSAILGEYDSYIEIAKHKETQKLKFDMRHAETPDPKQITFNPDTFWFEGDYPTNPVILILQQYGELERKILKEKLIEGGYFKPGNGAYARIDKDLKSGAIVLRQKKICLP